DHDANTTRTAAVRFPPAREKAADFSQSTNAAGVVTPIFDPLTGDANGNGRTQFPDNKIPANRLNPFAVKMLSYLPNPTRDLSNGSNNFDSIAQINDRAIMYTG